ncbi:MAG: helix-hairpin-helix domain-containing protein [Bacteroidetes bacterium]|nr:helix-hairpin-helix domain-containing protein [Bacteroidota bacterium]
MLIIFSQPLYRKLVPLTIEAQDTVKLNRILATWKWNDSSPSAKTVENTIDTGSYALFSFDPNKATEQQLIQLGFTKFQMERLIKYRAKGGRFAVKSDLLKLYGMDSSFYHQLYAFIDLPKTKTKPNEKLVIPQHKEEVVDINKADTTQLKQVYGIGSKLAQRIINYREKLGGFVSMQQVKEVYGLDSAVVKKVIQKFRVEEGFLPRQINVNTADAFALAKHPYLKKNVAQAIATYRFQHGAFTHLDDLLKIQLVTPDDLARIKPYLTLNP